MWLIIGPFDAEQVGDESAQKTKLLKPGKTYSVGRHKDSPLWINNKKISRNNGEFTVGEHTEDDVSNVASVPTLSLRNTKTSAMKVTRGESVFLVNPETTYELESGDTVKFANTIAATVTWTPKVCFQGEDTPVYDLAACASIGLKLVPKHSRDVTHHLIPTIKSPMSPSVLLSLLNSAQIVNPAWLTEFLQRESGFETTYDMPPEANYRPTIGTTEYPEMASSWSPNESRKKLFEGIRFVFVVIGSGIGSATKVMSDVVTRGGGERQLINVEKETEGSRTWEVVLKKRKTILKEGMRSGLVLVADANVLMDRGVPKETRNVWESMVERAKSVDMRFIHPSLIVEAIIKADTSMLDCVTNEVPLGLTSDHDFIPSTHPEESSQLPLILSSELAPTLETQPGMQLAAAGPSRRLTRRAKSQMPAPVLESTPAAEEEQPAPRKALLKRRAKAGGLVNELLGLDNTAIIEESFSSQGIPDPVIPTLARPARLKRRAGTVAPSSQLFPESQSIMQEEDEPSLKKFKALFEESGQGVMLTQLEDEFGPNTNVVENQLTMVMEEDEGETSQSQPQAGKQRERVDTMEHEGSQLQGQLQSQTKKRKAGDMREDENVEMDDPETSLRPKKRAVEDVNAVQRSGNSESQPAVRPAFRTATAVNASGKKGAAPGHPDTDPSFLQAIASSKRGKRTEDDFDREFNRLRIAKPNLNDASANAPDAVHQAQKWDVLDDFGKDTGIRGNFMQIVELKVWKDIQNSEPRRDTRRESGLGARLDWDGREDFKKFRRKSGNHHREAIQLVVSDGQEKDPGAPYFDYRGKKKIIGFEDMSQSQEQSYPLFTQSQVSNTRQRSQAKPKSRPKATFENPESEDEEVERKIGHVQNRRKRRTPALSKDEPKAKAVKKPALFESDSDDEDPPQRIIDGNTLSAAEGPSDFDLTLRSDPTQTQHEKIMTRGTKRKVPLEEDSDSDQGKTFGGFSKAKTTRK